MFSTSPDSTSGPGASPVKGSYGDILDVLNKLEEGGDLISSCTQKATAKNMDPGSGKDSRCSSGVKSADKIRYFIIHVAPSTKRQVSV